MRKFQISNYKSRIITNDQNHNNQTIWNLHFGVWFLFVIWCLEFGVYSSSASASENIRVAVAADLRTVTLKSEKGMAVEAGTSRGEKRIVFSSSQIGNRPVRIASNGTFIQMNGKSYRGWIELRKKKNGLLQVINELDVEEYLKGVVAAEIPHDWEVEALKAQAVASRTYALYRKQASGSRPYHILATVDSQVYGGRSEEHEAAARAVRETEGIVITYEGEIIPAFYHSSCGGHTENAFELWGIDASYLQGVDCDCQKISKYGQWEKRISLAQVVASLTRRGFRMNGIRDLRIDGVTAAGRVKQIAIRHPGGALSVPAEKFRAAVGYSLIPSIFFEIEMSGRDIVISGRGMGHGAGLCQWGAREMAQRGYDYTAILAYYYPGTRLAKRENLRNEK